MLHATLRILVGAAAGSIAAGMIAAASAAPLPKLDAAPSAPLVEQAHGCHHGILRDRRGVLDRGWHYHTRSCARVDVAPPGYADTPDRYGYEHSPRCSYQCRFVGPVKKCEQVCRQR